MNLSTNKILNLVAGVCVSALALTACASSEGQNISDPPPAASPTKSPTTQDPEPSPTRAPGPNDYANDTEPLVLMSSTGGGSTCFDTSHGRGRYDVALADYSWKANVDLDSFAVSLVDPRGLHLVGSPVVVPPVNFGGRIDFGGDFSWDSRSTLASVHHVSWAERGPLASWVPIAKQTGLLVLHVRFDKSTASFRGLTADYVDEDGTHGTARIVTPRVTFEHTSPHGSTGWC